MKKELLILGLLPAMLLASCAGGKQLTKEEAQKEADTITKNDAKKDIKNYEIKVAMNSSEGKGSDKTTSKAEYVLKANEDEDTYVRILTIEDNSKQDIEIYKVANEEYEEVTYVKSYNVTTEKYEELAFTKKDNLLYETQFELYSSYMLMPALAYMAYAEPDLSEYEEVDDEDSKVTVKYYSSGEGNLRVEAKGKAKGKADEDDEEPIESSTTLVYNNYLFSSYELSAKSNYGNVSSMKISAKYHDSKLKISLPSNWKNALEK